jgi:aminodeoxyfutalosine synthase
MEQVYAEAASNPYVREFHIVGGLDNHAGLAYYAEMFRGLKERHPDVHIKGLTAVEIAHIARLEKMSVRDTLIALREAGLDTLPGGGAEVFGRAVRATIADRKLAAEDWIGVHREAHRLGIRSNCTMLYGHVESIEDRVEHLSMLRDLQDETGGFLTYIPLAYHPDHNELGERLGRTCPRSRSTSVSTTWKARWCAKRSTTRLVPPPLRDWHWMRSSHSFAALAAFPSSVIRSTG